MPRIVPPTIVTAAISSDAWSDATSVGSFQNFSYHCSETPFITDSERCPLNEKTTTTAIGRKSQR